MERMEKRKDFYDVIDKIQRQDRYIKDLEEENKNLKEFKEKRKESRFYFKAQMERAEPKTAREAEDLQKAKEIFEGLYREELSCLEQENQKLKEELEKTNELLNNVVRCSEQYRGKMISVMEELKMFLYKD